VPRIDVTPDALRALAGRVDAVADVLDRQRLGTAGAIQAQASVSGGPISGSALDLSATADEAATRLVGAYRRVADLLRTGAGAYTTVDETAAR
jgi:uncharacterized protein YukE